MEKRLRPMMIALSPLVVAGAALFWGSYSVSPGLVVKALASGILGGSGMEGIPELSIIWNIRLPRVILAALVGGALSVSGVTLQGIFHNPLVDPFILGLSAGAAFGCALSIAFLPWLPIQGAAFLFSVLAAFLAYSLARTQGEVSRLPLVLSGVVISAFFSALVSILKFLVDPHKLASIVYWLMGSFSLADWKSTAVAAAGTGGGCGLLLLMRWRLNALSMGEEEARALGIHVERDRLLLIAGASLAVGCAVSVSGIIGWVGLMVPHLVRMMIGPDHRRLMPYTMAAGAAFLVFADTLARNLTSVDIPVGIITALSGAPFFIYLMRKGAGEGWGK
ncbi:MAG: iron ABC transporter permease [Syntrophobacteraceae bacterium]|nr:iron ABC transporter permease [Syntrophobacteraceae bacterium]